MSELPEKLETRIHGIEGAPSIYSNICLVRTSPEEVMLHFGQRMVGDHTQGNAVLTVYTNLWHAKRLAQALLESIGKYEAIFGEIPADPMTNLDPEKLKEMGVLDDDS